MNLDDDLGRGLDREDHFQTDDEENQAERTCDSCNDSDSDYGSSSSTSSSFSSPKRNPSMEESTTPTWPQSFRASMDMFTSVAAASSISFLKENAGEDTDGLLPSVSMNPESEPLIRRRNLGKDVVCSSPLSQHGQTSVSPRSQIVDVEDNKQCSYAQAILNGINILCGIGLLTTPYAVKEGGWLSLLILFIFGVICCYTGTLLKACLESSSGLQTYPDIAQAAFGVSGRLLVSVSQINSSIAACVEYIIMTSDNLSTLFPNTTMDLGGMHLEGHIIFPVVTTLIVMLTIWPRDMSLLSYLSVGGVGASILLAGCLLWTGIVNDVGVHSSGTALDLGNLPFAIGIYGFCFSGHAVFPNIYYSMREPSRFPSVLIVSFVFCWLMYTGVAICGYLFFGETVKSQFTLNMPAEFTASKIAVWTAVVNPITKYALTIMPVALSLEELIPFGRFRSYAASLGIRIVLVLSTLFVALAIPFFGSVMAFCGSFLAMLLAIIFPCACYISVFHGRLSRLQLASCIFAILVGAISAAVGTYASVMRIANDLR
ncbi:Amino acid transporter AVT1D [Linum grandiflorum]